MINLSGIGKTYKVAKREKGLGAAAKSLFHREYTYVQALSEVSFHINEGEIVGYIGPNGAGKSTTIKIMCGILVPDEGECTIAGYTPWRDRRKYVENIGVVFGQRTQLWWDVPVIDSLELLKDIYKLDEPKYKRNLDKFTEILDLREFINTPLRQLSLGQRMRCELCASLMHDPKILFLDEPTIGLDAVSKLAVRRFIKEINREDKTTVILTTHDMNDVEALTNRILLIGKGNLLYDGSLDSIKARYDRIKTVSILCYDDIPDVKLSGAVVTENENGRMVIEVDTEKCSVSEIIAKVSEQTELRDISITSKPVDEIIASMYRDMNIGGRS